MTSFTQLLPEHVCDDDCPGFGGDIPARPKVTERTSGIQRAKYAVEWPDSVIWLTVQAEGKVIFRSDCPHDNGHWHKENRASGARWLRLMRHWQSNGRPVSVGRVE